MNARTTVYDRNGRPDECRSVAQALTPMDVTAMDDVKLATNKIIADLNELYMVGGPQLRYRALAITAFEDAVMWATKAICTPQADKF